MQRCNGAGAEDLPEACDRRALTGFPKPKDASDVRSATILSRFTKAPPHTKRMSLVFICAHPNPQRTRSGRKGRAVGSCWTEAALAVLGSPSHRNEIAAGILPPALLRYIHSGALQDLQQRLLHALACEIACSTKLACKCALAFVFACRPTLVMHAARFSGSERAHAAGPSQWTGWGCLEWVVPVGAPETSRVMDALSERVILSTSSM